MPTRLNSMLRFSLILMVLGLAATARANPKVTVGQAVPAGSRVSIDRISHRAWDALLKKYVDRSGRVDYKRWKASAADQAALDSYLANLSTADTSVRANRAASLAYWINAYNAATIKGILREYPTSSIRNHTARIYGYNIWHDLQLVVGDRKYSLHSIEHEILRKSREPRIHFAIVCASISCPRLLNEAYAPERLESQLAGNMKEFFASPANFQYRNGAFAMSSIMKWFATDFGANRQAQLRYIAPYLPSPAAQKAAEQGNGRVSYLSYDWGLNDQATARTARR